LSASPAWLSVVAPSLERTSDKGRVSAGAGIPADEHVGAWLRDREVGGLALADLPVLFGLDPAGLGQDGQLSLLVLWDRARGMCEAAAARPPGPEDPGGPDEQLSDAELSPSDQATLG
jgi:hypothetical protein